VTTLIWIVGHAALFGGTALLSRSGISGGSSIAFFGFAPALGLWQAALLPAVDGRWQWPILTCAGVLIAQFFPWLFAWQLGLLVGLAQFSLLQESGYRRAGLWLVASSAGWAAGGLVSSFWITPVTAELGCDPAAAITGLLYGAATAAALAVLQRDGRQPRRPWSEP